MADLRECIAQLFKDMRSENYKLSREELEAAERCQSKIKSTCLEAFLAAGSILWSVTGGVQLMPRLVASVAGASAGAMLSLNFSVKHCAEEFLTLDGSHLQEKLLAILQNQAVLKPRTRAILEKYYYLEPLYDDSGEETPSIALRKREVAGVSLEKPSREIDSFGKDPDWLGNADQTSSNPKDITEPSLTNKTQDVANSHLQGHRSNHTVIHDDALEDPFKSLLWSEAEESNKLAVDRKHKGRMGVLERREYNRARYLQWQEKRNTSEWDNHAQQTEL